MPYFFILPAFVLYFLAMSVAIAVTFLWRQIAPLRRYFVSILIWSSLGLILSTVVYVLLLIASVYLLRQVGDGKPSLVGGVAMGGMVFIVPFVTAAVGILGGSVFGLSRCLKKPGQQPNALP